jgi:hypothetical protein
MPRRRLSKAERQEEIRQSLQEANVGCLALFLGVFGLPLVAIGVLFIVLGFNSMHDQARLNTSAVEVEATILSSEVVRSTSGRQGQHTTIFPQVSFTYQAEDPETGGMRRYVSEKVWAVGESVTGAEAQRIVGRYPAGVEVSALVDPEDPGVAFLERRWAQGAYLSVAAGLLPAAFIGSLGVMLIGWRWFGRTVIAAGLLTCALVVMGALAARHYYVVMPTAERVGWVGVALIVVSVLGFGPVVMLLKARWLSGLYRGGGPAA